MDKPKQPGLIAYFTYNSVAANLLMVFILVLGIASYFTIQRQMFPNFELNYIQIEAVYPGASPQEIEESILIKIEEVLKDVTEIEQIISRGNRNGGRVSLKIDPKKPLTEVLDKVKLRVDGIATFPAGMEPIIVRQEEFQQEVIEMSLVGDLPLAELKPVAQRLEDELLQLANVSLVQLNAPEEEIAIEVHPEAMRTYQLSLADVTRAIQRDATNLSAGQLRTENGIVSVRVENQYYRGQEFGQIPVKLGQDGARVLLRDIATIKDDFTEGERYFKYSGKNAIYLSVKATKEQNMVPVAKSVKAFIEARNKTLPPGMELKMLVDMTYYLNARLDMMLKNLLQGGILVALMLSVFLRLKLALWVMMGLPVCFLGAVMLMPVMGVTINIVSLFAFIMVLGIVVDDAIVIGESVYTEIESHGGGTETVIRGAKRVATPATFGVLTTIAVFAPFILSTGPERAFFYGIASIVILCLIFSLIESKLILPAHLAHTRFDPVEPGTWRARFNESFFRFVNGPYQRFILRCIAWRWLVLSVFISLLLLSIALISANYVRMVPTPKVPHDFPSIIMEMNDSVSEQQTIDALKSVERMILAEDERTRASYGQAMIKDLLAYNRGRTEARIVVPLVDEAIRPYDAFELSRRWRENMPVIPGLKSLSIQDDVNDMGTEGEFGYLLFGSDEKTLYRAGRQFIQMLRQQTGLYDISSTIDPASQEVQMSLLPVAYDLGLDLTDIASQVGMGFYGAEAQRIIREGEEVRVMVRYPKLTREAFSSLKYSLITTPAGHQVMLGDVAELKEVPGTSYIRREGGYRSVYVWGAIDENVVEPDEVVKTIKDSLLPKLKTQFPSVLTELGGEIEEQQAQQNEQGIFFLAGMIIVYILLAVPLKSYSQPLIIMSVIPFSLTGAVWGHYFLGLDISMMSTFGLIAAAGVVINDSLVMTDYINQRRREGAPILDAVTEAGSARFRAITLTSITTFVGVLPIMFETSLQARFVIPMAVALGFAVMFATIVTLTLVPCLYLILQDLGKPFALIKRKWGGAKT